MVFLLLSFTAVVDTGDGGELGAWKLAENQVFLFHDCTW